MSNNESSWGSIIFMLFMGLVIFILETYCGVVIWNYIAPDLFGFSEITFSKMIWLALLIRLIFPHQTISLNK